MDKIKAYYDWINSLADIFKNELETKIDKKFAKDEEMIWGAAKHSEAMMEYGEPFWTHGEFAGDLGDKISRIEFVQDGVSDYNQVAIEQTLKRMVHNFLNSLNPPYLSVLKYYHFIGVGVAIREIRHGDNFFSEPGMIIIYVDIRLAGKK